MLPEFCFCAHLRTVDTRCAVDIVMHFREANKASNTARLAVLSLPKARVHVRGSIDAVFDAEAVFLPDHQPLYLFPSEEAVPLSEAHVRELERRDPRPFQLIVPDGSWSQARKMQEREPAFRRLPCVALHGLSSRYRLRQGPRTGSLATFEAVAHVLSVIEGRERMSALFDNFEIMVEQNLKSRGLLSYDLHSRAPRSGNSASLRPSPPL